MAARGIE